MLTMDETGISGRMTKTTCPTGSWSQTSFVLRPWSFVGALTVTLYDV
jgi:hypothetical protein